MVSKIQDCLISFRKSTNCRNQFHLPKNGRVWNITTRKKGALSIQPKISLWIFRQLPIASGTVFSKISKKGTTSWGTPKFSKKVSRTLSFHSTLLLEFLEVWVEWVAFRDFSSFRNFWKLFGEISIPFAAVSKFSKVSVEWRPRATSTRSVAPKFFSETTQKVVCPLLNFQLETF